MFKGLGNLGNLAHLVKEAGKIRERMEELQEKLAEIFVDATSGGGMVKVRANGKQEIVSLEIDDEVANGGDKKMLEDLVAAACNEAISRSKEVVREEVAKVTGGVASDLPGII